MCKMRSFGRTMSGSNGPRLQKVSAKLRLEAAEGRPGSDWEGGQTASLQTSSGRDVRVFLMEEPDPQSGRRGDHDSRNNVERRCCLVTREMYEPGRYRDPYA